MRTKTATIICAIAGLVIFGIGLAKADSPNDMAALQAVDETWLKAHNTGDADTLASLYEEHAVLLPPGAPPVHGRAAIRAFFVKDTAESAEAGIQLSLGKATGGVSGDMGWQSGTYVAKDKSGTVVDTGKYLSVSTKKAGKWLYVRDTWNSDMPPAPAPSTAPPKK